LIRQLRPCGPGVTVEFVSPGDKKLIATEPPRVVNPIPEVRFVTGG